MYRARREANKENDNKEDRLKKTKALIERCENQVNERELKAE